VLSGEAFEPAEAIARKGRQLSGEAPPQLGGQPARRLSPEEHVEAGTDHRAEQEIWVHLIRPQRKTTANPLRRAADSADWAN
jgi:hypothetical protein